MENQKELKISSGWTNIVLYMGAILLIAITPLLIYTVKTQKYHDGMIIGSIIYIALLIFIIYLFIYTCKAKVVGDRLILKKNFRPEKSYSFDKIGYIDSFQVKRTRFITVDIKQDNNTTEKYIIMNVRSLLSFENIDAESVLMQLKISAMKREK